MEFRTNPITAVESPETLLGLVDADIVAYRCAAAGEEDSVDEVLSAVDNYMRQIMRDTKLGKYVLFLTDSPSNFRNTVAVSKPYKGNRKDLQRPQHLGAVREYLMEHYNAMMVHGYEADDAIASAANRFMKSVVMTIDKDLLQIPGIHYNFVKEEWMFVGEDDARHNLWMQVITGDTTDNIPGLPKVGPAKWKAAATAHEDVKDYAEIAWEMYQERGATKEYFNEQLDLVRMRLDLTYLPYEEHIIPGLTEAEMQEEVISALEGFDSV